MKLSLFDYHLPKERIAQSPANPRDSARLLIYDRKTGKVKHEVFRNLPEYLTANDVLVFNNSKVFPARLRGKKESGGKAELLLLKHLGPKKWECLVGTSNPRPGIKLVFAHGLIGEILNTAEEKTWVVEFNCPDKEMFEHLEKIGEIPLPPYISSTEKQTVLKKQYQTVYAEPVGSSAAPTAGLHFTENLLSKIKKMGCQIEYVTLHVGLGTFNPINVEDIEKYHIHSEDVSVDKETLKRLIAAKKQGKRIIAVGTTAVRTLEAVFTDMLSRNNDFVQSVNIYIYPPYKFKFVDAMITNFHLPKSSLLVLVSAFAGRKNIQEIYRKAIKNKYRFFSFGDASFLK